MQPQRRAVVRRQHRRHLRQPASRSRDFHQRNHPRLRRHRDACHLSGDGDGRGVELRGVCVVEETKCGPGRVSMCRDNAIVVCGNTRYPCPEEMVSNCLDEATWASAVSRILNRQAWSLRANCVYGTDGNGHCAYFDTACHPGATSKSGPKTTHVPWTRFTSRSPPMI